jgi:hypothetical protein
MEANLSIITTGGSLHADAGMNFLEKLKRIGVRVDLF